MGAIAVIRVSGKEAFAVVGKLFSKTVANLPSHTVHYGTIKDGSRIVDEVVATIFKGPNSFTGEDVVEISCHGSVFIQQQIIQLLLDAGCRMANAGEFTMRAFFNGKMDLSQAEAVADLIASNSEAAHQLAMHQMRGGFSKEINHLRQELINFASLIELELDFSEEDVEFADRSDLKTLVEQIQVIIKRLVDSFAVGNVIKNGIPVAIVGVPNVGKSTLLNALLNEERAIVSDIAGTTRDTIEDELIIEGIAFRFIDTAGLRDTTDTIESMGIERTYEKANEAAIILYMADMSTEKPDAVEKAITTFRNKLDGHQQLIPVYNKADIGEKGFEPPVEGITISAKAGTGIETLKEQLVSFVDSGALQSNDTIVTNARHYEALSKAFASLNNVLTGLDANITGDFLAIDIRQALHHLGEITGEITTDDLLGNIFSKFCIGK